MPDVNTILAATHNETLPRLTPGNYKLLINTAFFKPVDQSKGGGEAFISELTILESDNPRHKVGSQASTYQGQGYRFDGAVKAFLLRALGVQDIEAATPEQLQQLGALIQGMATNKALLSQYTISCSARMLRTKEGKGFCACSFAVWRPDTNWVAQPTPDKPVEPQTIEEAEGLPPAPVGPPAMTFPGQPPPQAMPAATGVSVVMPHQYAHPAGPLQQSTPQVSPTYAQTPPPQAPPTYTQPQDPPAAPAPTVAPPTAPPGWVPPQ